MPVEDFKQYLHQLVSEPGYRGQIVHTRTLEPREAVYGEPSMPLHESCSEYLRSAGIERLYRHQAEAIDAIRAGKDVLIATGTASGKSLCYQIPLLEMLAADSEGRAVLLYPTKALAQDQFRALNSPSFRMPLGRDAPFQPPLADWGGPSDVQRSVLNSALIGVFDGDTPGAVRRKLRDEGRIILTNPDMLHASILPQHPKWAGFLANLRYVVVDELHTYSGLFGSNAANLFRRLWRVCRHYGSEPVCVFCTATIGNPAELARTLTGRDPVLIEEDGSPRGRKTYVFWNPPRELVCRRNKTRRSANVEAHELMGRLVGLGVPTITFSKAKVTAELIYRYVSEYLKAAAPNMADRVTPYRGGYLPEERREIERKLFSGELLGVSTTRALELGIDIGGLDAAVVVGYPGTLAGFFQQTGRAGRRCRDSIAFLVAVDTAVNQYVMNNPDYIFGRPVERAVLDPDNAYVLAGQLRCAAFEMPIDESETGLFGPYAALVLDVLEQQGKLRKIGGRWYHASEDIPHHDHGLRWCDRFNVTITDADTGRVIGEMSKYDAQPILHPDAIYLHQGDTYLVLDLDLQRSQCLVKKVDADYYTQPSGGEDVHHIDHPLRQKKFGNATAFFGEVSVYFTIAEYEKIHFYSLEPVSRHKLNLPTYQLETMAFWITVSEELARDVMGEGLNVHRGLMGIGYAVRMILPLFISCETLDFSHSSCTAVNAPWHTVFVYERYPLGLGFTEKAYEILGELITAVRDRIRKCDCRDGCPCCVGKPLRGYTTWNIELGEANIPSKQAALRLLDGIIGGGSALSSVDDDSLGQDEAERKLLLERGIRRRLERLSDPEHIFHPVDPSPQTGYPEPAKAARPSGSDVARRAIKRMSLAKQAGGRLAESAALQDLRHEEPVKAIELGDSVASRARKMKRNA